MAAVLFVGWALGVLTTLGYLTLSSSFYEYRLISIRSAIDGMPEQRWEILQDFDGLVYVRRPRFVLP